MEETGQGPRTPKWKRQAKGLKYIYGERKTKAGDSHGNPEVAGTFQRLETAEQLTVPAALVEQLNSVPSTHGMRSLPPLLTSTGTSHTGAQKHNLN